MMERTNLATDNERFLATNSMSGEELPIRKFTSEQLATVHAELKTQFEEVQADFLDAVNRQLTLSRYLAAIEFEQERRTAQGRN